MQQFRMFLLCNTPDMTAEAYMSLRLMPRMRERQQGLLSRSMPFPLRKSDFLDLLGIRDETFIESLVDCAVWHGDVELDHVQQYNIRHGLSFIVILNHLRDIIARAARTPTASSSSTALLQVHQQRRVILLDELISEDEPVMQTGMVAVRVKWLASSQPSPSYITLSAEATHDDAAAELACWGLKALPVLCNECGVVVCLSAEPCETLHYDYVFVNTAFHGGSNMQDVIGHTDRKQLQTNELMSVLYQLGFWRAIIASEEEIYPSVFKVCFLDQVVTINEKPHKPQKNVDWPKPQPTGEHTRQPFFHDPSHTESDQLVDLGVQTSDLHELFLSHQDLLCLDFVGYELPEELQAAVDQCDPSIPIEEIDRFLVYTDGSSLGSAKHAPPMRAEEDGTGDTWAYVIVGERYAPPGIKFMGWTAQQVHYDPTSNAHLGAKRIGADIAEKEALSWAALWRLSFNQKTPTCFRSDSRVALGQAAGTTGAAEMDETFAFLRGAFQAIEAALGRDGVQYQHVPGHAGEAWNEICDWLVKRERQRSFYCPRPRMDMRKWKAAMSHLWLIVGQHADLPRFCGKGLHAPAPQLPQQHDPAGSEDTRGQTTTQQWDLMEFTVSACSVNVNSLSGAPEGHGGRLDYLRSQFAMLGFNFLGAQESKTPEFHSCVNQVLRMSSGHQNHQQGVELWINLAQPYGSIQGRPQLFDRHDFQVVYKSPRSLLVSVDTRFWRCWLLVAYAPHSGISHAERAQWWHTLSEALHHKPATDPLIVMLDANAGPGDYDGVAVHQTGFATSSGTSLLRSFAEEQGLFFPCTTTAHVGPTETWTDPTGEKSYCIDYVLLTHHFRGQCHLSRVVEEFDLGRTAWDHEATAVELQWQEWLQRRSRISPDGLGFDPEQINGQTVHSVLSTYAPPTWETNIEAHVGDFNKVLLQGLRQHCPPPRRGPKKAYMTEQSWQLRGSKLKFKKQIQQLFRRQRDERMIFFFKLWRHRRTDQKVWEEYQSYSEYLWRANFKLVGQHRKAMLQLRQHLSKAKQETIRLKFAEMDPNAPASAILHELKPLLGPSNLKKLKVSPLPQIRNAHGEACCLPNEAVEAWLEFFRQMEGGTRMDRRQQRDLWIANLQRFRQQEFHVQAEELPRLIDLEAAYRRINPYKAVGPDKLHPAFCRMNPSFLARLTFSQLWKLTLHGQEALDHKGGMLFPIWKSKGPKDCCTSYRSILVSSFIGKSLHRSLRQRQTALFERYMQTEQLGGRPKAPVTLGVHLGRAFLRARRSQGHNVAMLYLDLTEAFYRILRPLVTGGPVSDEMVMHVGRKLGFTEDLLEELYKHLSEPVAIAEANLPKHMQIAITALHEDTFFTVKGQGDVCRTTLGSRPGDCFADVIFSYLWGRILRRLQVTLTDMQIDDKIPADTGLSLSGPQSESSRSFLGPTWMDDTCVCVSDPSPQRLEAKIHQATGRLLDLCETHGLSPNLSPGKTEALLVFQGRGSRQMRIRYFGPTSDRSLKIMGEKGIMKVRAVAQYTHLGCVIHHQSDQRREARRRIGMAHQTFTQHRRHLLQNPVLSMQRRFELFKSLVWSRLSYGTETWTFSEGRTKEYIHNAVMRLLRCLLGRAHDAHLMDDDILTEVGANSPTELLRLSRLRYLGTLHKCTHLVPWGLINSDQQWIELIKDDLRWLWMQLHGSSQLPDPLINMAVWEDIWLHHPSYWRRLVRRGGEHAILQRRRNHRVVQFHHRFTQVFESVHPGSFARQAQANEELPEAARLEEQHACMRCQQTFRSKGGLGAHLFKKHGVISRLRLLFDTTCCGACLREYHTYSKLHAHLRHAAACREQLWGRRQRMAPVAGAGSVEDRELCNVHDGILPPLQAEGPCIAAGAAVPLPEYGLCLAETIYEKVLERGEAEDIDSVILHSIQDYVITWASCKATLGYLIENLTEQDLEILNLGEYDMVERLRQLQKAESWPFLCLTGSRPRHRASTMTLAEMEQQCLDAVEAANTRQRLWDVPRPMAKERFIIHAFSGRRRAGDFQHFIELIQKDYPEMLVHTISVDLMVDPTWGDVSQPKVRDFWLRAVKQRQVVGALAGPPCETWSQARGKQLPTDPKGRAKRGPRIVRDLADLWGRAALALKEVRQLDVGNLLLLFTLELLIELALADGVGGLEHPAPPADETRASIWRLPLLQFLMEWPEFETLDISQGLWGAKSRKPTRLLLLNLKKMVPELRRWQLTGTLPTGVSIGLTDSGEWATSALKEYPPALCAGLASGFLASLQEYPVEEGVEIDDIFRKQALAMVITQYSAGIGPDFAQ